MHRGDGSEWHLLRTPSASAGQEQLISQPASARAYLQGSMPEAYPAINTHLDAAC